MGQLSDAGQAIGNELFGPRGRRQWSEVAASGLAATSVVGDGGDYPLTEAGLAAAIAVGGKIFVRGTGTLSVASGFTFPDKSVTLEFDPRLTIDISTNVITLFTVPNGLTAMRQYVVERLNLTGGETAGQTVSKLSDANARGWLWLRNVNITGMPIIVDVTAGDSADYLDSVYVFIEGGRIMPFAGASNAFFKSAAVAGTFSFPIIVKMSDVQAYDENNLTHSWNFDFDGDISMERCGFGIVGTAECDGLDLVGTYFQSPVASPGTVELKGQSFYANGDINNNWIYQTTIKISTMDWKVSNNTFSGTDAKVILNGDRNLVKGNDFRSQASGSGQATDYWIDVLDTSDGCIIEGNSFRDATIAAIRTATASGILISSCFFASTAARLTVTETGSADYTFVSKCHGIGSGGGFSLPGSNSRVDGVQAGNATGAGSVGSGWARLESVHVAVGNVGAGTDDLQTYPLPAKALDIAKRTVRVKAWGTTANNANAKTVTLNVGGQVVMTQALTTNIAGTWRIDCEIIKTGTDTQDIFAELLQLATIIHKQTITAGTQDDGAAITIKCTGDATDNNDIVQEGMIVEIS